MSRKRTRGEAEDGTYRSASGREIKRSVRSFDHLDDDDGPTEPARASGSLTQYFPRRSSETYPAHLAVNFQQLPHSSLQSYIAHFQLRTRTDASAQELAVGVAQHFDHFFELDQTETEDRIISAFVTRYKKAKRAGGRRGAGRHAERERDAGALEVGDQVAAKVGGDWILGTIVRCFPQKERYQIEDEDSGDEDDAKGGRASRRRHVLGANQICALPTEGSNNFPAGSRVMAVYPHTTSFYPGTVMQSPRNAATARIIIKFDDDEDEHGVTQEHRITRNHVLQLRH
eukprot:g5596.t1